MNDVSELYLARAGRPKPWRNSPEVGSKVGSSMVHCLCLNKHAKTKPKQGKSLRCCVLLNRNKTTEIKKQRN